MTTYAYRLRAKTSPGRVFKLSDEHEDAIDLDVGYPARLRLPTDREAKAEVVLSGRGFATEENARSAGEHARSALRIAALVGGHPIDVGIERDRRDKPTTALNPTIREKILAEQGTRVLNDVFGLQIYPDDVPATVISSSGVGIVTHTNTNALVESLRASLVADDRELSARAALAMDLYFLAQFESTVRAKILALVTSLEVLSEEAPRPERVLDHLERLIEETHDATRNVDDLEEARAFDRFSGALTRLRTDSITQAIRTLVDNHVPNDERYGGVAPVKFAAECYGVRSKLVHEGEEPEGVVLTELHGDLSRLVKAVLLSVAGAAP